MAHRSQFSQGEESLEWMKELDRKPGEEKISLAAKPGLTQTASSQGGRG
jgi:hypothetical protein